MKNKLLLLSGLVLLAGCNGGPNQTNIELIQNMMDQPAIKSQGWNPEQGDQVQMRMPPEGTVSRGHPPYAFQNDPAGAEKQINPLAGNMSPETLTLGHKTFDIYCAVCHGNEGRGDGRVAVKMAVKPRNLIADDAKAYTDGRIYHAVTAGKGVMGSYASQITDANRRWAVVNYVRTLQRQIK
jgi:mono/diheme cytochrome c family protein